MWTITAHVFSTYMYYNNSVMYHEPMHKLHVYYTGNTVIIELNKI